MPKAVRIFTTAEQDRICRALKENPLDLAEIVFTITHNTTGSGCELRLLRLRDLELTSETPKIHIPREATKNSVRPRTIPPNEGALEAFKRAVARAKRLGSPCRRKQLREIAFTQPRWQLRLIEWEERHREAFALLHSDPIVMADQGGPMTRMDCDAKLNRYRAEFKRTEVSRCAVETLEGEFIGYVGVTARPQGSNPLGSHHDVGLEADTKRVGPWLCHRKCSSRYSACFSPSLYPGNSCLHEPKQSKVSGGHAAPGAHAGSGERLPARMRRAET